MKIAGYEVHPAAELFEMLDESSLARLTEDIKAQGLKVPVILLDGKILDGRNRLVACTKAGVKPRFVEHDSSENPWRAVWSLNRERRHITDVIRLALKGEDMIKGSTAWESKQAKAREKTREKRSTAKAGNKNASKNNAPARAGTLKDRSESTRANEEVSRVAEAVGVTRAAVERARQLATDVELAKAVSSGELKGMEGLRQVKAKKAQAKASSEPPSGKYRVIYADPPWSYSNSMPDGSDGTRAMLATTPRDHYPTMTLSEICALPVKTWAEDNAVLFLWTTSPLLEESFDVIRAWGFTYKTSFVWDKVKHNVGHYNSVRHEFLLICTRGACTPDVQRLFDSVVSIERTAHSVKPDFFYEVIETLYTHGDRLEMFARRSRPGWNAWGLEAPSAVA